MSNSDGADYSVHHIHAGDDSFDGNLEVDVFELATVAGATAAGGETTADLRAHAAELARTDGPLSTAESLFSEAKPATLADHL